MVDRVIGLSHGTDKTTDRIHLLFTSVNSILIYNSNGKLNGSVILWVDDTVSNGTSVEQKVSEKS